MTMPEFLEWELRQEFRYEFELAPNKLGRWLRWKVWPKMAMSQRVRHDKHTQDAPRGRSGESGDGGAERRKDDSGTSEPVWGASEPDLKCGFEPGQFR
jgi:hypothetical protein